MRSDFTKSAWRLKCMVQVLDRNISIPWEMVNLELSINKKRNTSVFQGISSAFCCLYLGFAQKTSQCPVFWWNRTCGNNREIFTKELENKSKINNLRQTYIENFSANAFKINMFLSSFQFQAIFSAAKKQSKEVVLLIMGTAFIKRLSSLLILQEQNNFCRDLRMQTPWAPTPKPQPDVADLSLKSHGEALSAKQFHPPISWPMLEHKPSLPAGPRQGRPQVNWQVTDPHRHSTPHSPFLSPFFPVWRNKCKLLLETRKIT